MIFVPAYPASTRPPNTYRPRLGYGQRRNTYGLPIASAKVRNEIRKMPDALWPGTRYSGYTELTNTHERSASMLRNFFSKEAGRDMVMLIVIYVAVITVVAALMAVFGL